MFSPLCRLANWERLDSAVSTYYLFRNPFHVIKHYYSTQCVVLLSTVYSPSSESVSHSADRKKTPSLGTRETLTSPLRVLEKSQRAAGVEFQTSWDGGPLFEGRARVSSTHARKPFIVLRTPPRCRWEEKYIVGKTPLPPSSP